MPKVFNRNEIYLFGSYYPILAEVQASLRPNFAAKQVIGDYTKDSELDVSSITWSDHRGGMLIKDMKESLHADRCYFTKACIDYPGHLIAQPLAVNCGNPTVSLDNATLMVEYNNELWVVFDKDVYKWEENGWSAVLHTLSDTPTSALVHYGKLYFACGDNFERFDGSNWTNGTDLSGTAVPSRFLLNWDEKLIVLDNTGKLSFSVDEGVSFTVNAQSTLPEGYFNSLFLARNNFDQIVPHLGTRIGIYELDFDGGAWLNTGLSFPPHQHACKGATTWRDAAAYIPVGMSIYQYISAADPIIINPMGLDRDYGMPKEYRGNIILLLAEHNALYALLDATSEDEPLYPAWPSWDSVFSDVTGYSALLKWNGKGWSIVCSSDSDAAPATCGLISNANDKYRLWFCMDRNVFYIPLNTDLQNPIEIKDYDYASSLQHITGWFDGDNAVVDKLGLSVVVCAESTSSEEFIQVYYGLDYDENTWILLTSSVFPDGRINTNGEHRLALGNESGVNFKSIRFKIEAFRGTDPTKFPDLRWLRLDYMKLTDARWRYQVVVDCTRDYRHKRKSTLVDSLKSAAENKTLGDFIYRTLDGINEVRKVRIISMDGPEKGGNLKIGQYRLHLLAP